jgi:y4mF family transcriptional regulator
MPKLDTFIKDRRKTLGLTQPELAEKAGVGLRFIREMEAGKTTLRLDRVNAVLALFGQELAPVPIDRSSYADETHMVPSRELEE